MTVSNNLPLLTVCVLTYEHSETIEESLLSILAQETSFNLDVLVFDDASSDGAADIIMDVARRYPGRLRYKLRDRNVGGGHNFLELVRQPRTKYIAYMEGDDYWTDNYKLEKQVNALESDLELSLCFHDVMVTDNTSNHSQLFPGGTVLRFSSKDVLLKSWFCPTSSIMYRSSIIGLFPDDYGDSHPINGDVFLLYLASTVGDLLRIPDCMGVYNYRSASSSSAEIEIKLSADLEKISNMLGTTFYILKRATCKEYPLIFLKCMKLVVMLVFSGIKYFVKR